MFKRFGASIYLGLEDYTISDNLSYLEMLACEGAELVFISAHMPERSSSFAAELKLLLSKARELELKIILDVNKSVFNQMTTFSDIYALRLDYGFDMQEMIEISQSVPCLIELNASTVDKLLLEALKANHLDHKKIRFSFNFYPKEYTGMTYEDVVRITELLRSYKFPVMMFIPSSSCKRPPLYKGLPTIEEHRNLTLTAILADLVILDIEEVVFSDAICNITEIRKLKRIVSDVIELPMELFVRPTKEVEQLLADTHKLRKDQSKYLLRTTTRYQDEIESYHTVEREPFFVTMDNVLYKRYNGEVAICLEKLEKDERVNVIGKLQISRFLLKHLSDSYKIRFTIKGE